MKRVLLVALVLIVSVQSALAGGGTISLYGEPSGYDFCVFDNAPGLITIYIVHRFHDGVTGSSFAAPIPDCFASASYIQWVGDCPILGCPDPIGGDWFYYPGCETGTVVVGAMTFFGIGVSPQCCEYWVTPNPNTGASDIEALDCDGNVIPALGWRAIINPGPNCPECIVPVEETTWGAVKALYLR